MGNSGCYEGNGAIGKKGSRQNFHNLNGSISLWLQLCVNWLFLYANQAGCEDNGEIAKKGGLWEKES